MIKGHQIPIKHGTTAGASLHKKRNIPICEPCRIARNEYEKERHQKARARTKYNLETLIVRSRVLTRMAKLYPKAYQEFLAQEVSKRRLERKG